MRRFILFVLMILIPVIARAQNTVVTATVLDPNGNAYAFSTGYAALVCPGNAAPTFNGFSMPRTFTITGFNGTGTFTQQLYDVSLIQPTGCGYQWHITYKDGVTNFITGTITTVTGSSVNLSTLISSYSVLLPTTGGGGGGTPGGANTQVQYNAGGSFGGNSSFTFTPATGNLSIPGIDKILYVDGIKYANLAAAYAACTGNCMIFDAMPETITANPFATCQSTGYSSIVYLAANVGTEVPILIACSGLIIRGTGDQSNGGFYAAASFCSGSYSGAAGCSDGYPIVEIGSTSVPQFTFSTRLEDLVLNCNSITNCLPFLGSGLAESSGARDVAAQGFLGIGFSLTTSYTTNFQMEQLKADPAATATTAIGLKVNGIDMDNNAIKQISVVPAAGGTLSECIDIENSSAEMVEVHCEGAIYGVLVNNSRYTIIGYHTGQGTANLAPTDHIRITGTSIGTVIDENADNPNYGTNLIHNTTTGTTITVAAASGKLINYWNGQNSSGDGECYVYFGGGGTTCNGIFAGGNLQSFGYVLADTTFRCPETTAPSGVASSDLLYCDSTAHRWKMINNNGGGFNVPGIATAGTSGHVVTLAANGIDLVDGGAIPGGGNVSSSGSPSQYQIALWASGSTIEGVGPGTSGYPFVSNGAGAYGSFQQLTSGGLNITPTSCTNQFVRGISSAAVGTCNAIALADTPLTTSQDILYDNAGALGRLPIVNLNTCLGNAFGQWASIACSAFTGLTTNGVLYATSSSTVSSPAVPTTNGSYLCGYTVVGSASVPPTCSLAGLAARGVGGTTSTDTALYSDNNNITDYEGSVAVATALPTPTSLLNPNWFGVYSNFTVGSNTAVTWTPATWTVLGLSTFAQQLGQTCSFYPDPLVMANWIPDCHEPPIIAGSNITLTRSAHSLTIAASGGGGGVGYGAGAGSVNAMTVTTSPVINTAVAGTIVEVLPNLANTTTTPTLKVGTSGALTIVKGPGQTALVASDYNTTTNSIFLSDGTYWQLLNPLNPLYTSVSTGTSPPACSGGTSGASCFGEGTAVTAAASVDDIYADSTGHCLTAINNNVNRGCITSTAAAPAAITIGSGTSISSTSLCASAVCTAGLYQISAYLDITTACGTTGTYLVDLIYTDDQGSKTVPINLSGTGAVPATGVVTTTSTSNFGQAVQVIRSTGGASINYSTTAVACGSAGPMVGKLYLTATPVSQQ